MSGTRLKALVSNPTDKSDGTPAPFVALDHIEARQGRLRADAAIEQEERPEAVRYRPGDVLFGKLRPYLGKVIAPEEPGTCSSELLVLRPDVRQLNPRFLYYLTLSRPFVDWAVATSEGVKMPRTGWGALGGFRLGTVPTVSEQKEMVAQLDSECSRLDELVAEQKRLISLAAERSQVVVDGAFDPVAGTRTKLKYMLREKPTYGVLVPVFEDDIKAVPFIRVGDIPSLRSSDPDQLAAARQELRRIPETLSRQYRRTVLAGGEVLLGVVGNMGTAAVVPPAMAGANVARAVAVLRTVDELPADLLSHWFRSSHFREQATLATSGDSIQPTLGMGDLSNFEIYLPTRSDERSRLLAQLHERNVVMEALQNEAGRVIELLHEHKQALITAVVTGQKEVA